MLRAGALVKAHRTLAAGTPDDLAPTDAPLRSGRADSDQRPRLRRIALVGNPNVGKSVVFGALTGTYATVSNYPGTTVELTRATARGDPAIEVIDTPGVDSLTPNSEDERVTRDILLEGVESVVQVADAKNLPRALALSLQLAEAGLPFVVALNMTDEAADRGLRIDATTLSAELGVPVVPTVAVTGQGMGALREALAAATVSHRRARYPAAVERALLQTERLLAGFGLGPRWLALMCLAGDDTLRPWLARHLSAAALAAIEDAHRKLQAELPARIGYQLSRARMRAADELARAVTRTVASAEPATPADLRPWATVAGLAFAGALVLLAGDLGVLPFLTDARVRVAGWLAIAAAALAADRSPALRAALGRWATRRGSGLAMLFVVLYVLYRFVGVLAAQRGVDFLEHRVFVIVKERGMRTALAMSAFIFPFAFCVGGAVNLALHAAGLP